MASSPRGVDLSVLLGVPGVGCGLGGGLGGGLQPGDLIVGEHGAAGAAAALQGRLHVRERGEVVGAVDADVLNLVELE